jgi:hypothetical protein
MIDLGASLGESLLVGELKMYRTVLVWLLLVVSWPLHAQDSLENYIKEYPNQQQVKMMEIWLQGSKPGTFRFSGLVDPTDATVVTPQATVDYGYNWFSISNGPAIITAPAYDRFFSVSIFDMKHNVPSVVVNPDKPILIRRPDQEVPAGDFTVVTLETDQGLAFTRMLVVNNMADVRELSKSIVMTGGDGNMYRPVQRFSPEIEKDGLGLIAASIPFLNPDIAFGKKSGDVGEITQAGAVMLGQLGTPSDTVRYEGILADENGQAFNGKDTYALTVPANIIRAGGYYSVTVYGSDNKLLIPNEKKIYDRTTYSSEQNADGTYTLTLSPDGGGLNGIPTGKPFYGLLRAYVPVPGADMSVAVENK